MDLLQSEGSLADGTHENIMVCEVVIHYFIDTFMSILDENFSAEYCQKYNAKDSDV
jgi:hypothetical protein